MTIVVLAFFMLLLTEQANNNVTMDISSVTQVVSDWSVKPFVEIVTQTAPCETAQGFENVFDKVWAGSEDGCKRTPKVSE